MDECAPGGDSASLEGTFPGGGDAAGAVDDETAMPAATEYAAEIVKTDKGLGIYFARDAQSGALVVDGFVDGFVDGTGEDGDASLNEMGSSLGAGLSLLRVGDVLTHINGADCSRLEATEVVALLRSTPAGANTLQLRRAAAHPQQEEEQASGEPAQSEKEEGGSLAGSLIGALRKVTSRITAEKNEEARREQEAAERFEKQWLAEFERFKAAHEARWQTCTYSADEFCGHVHGSSDAQQRARLEQEYPTLMRAWRECRAFPNAPPLWPAVKAAVGPALVYTEPPASAARNVECAAALQEALEFLQGEFMWRPSHVAALGRRLEALGVCSCAELAAAMEAGARSCLFERRLQSPAFPRLTKALCRALRSRAEQAAAQRGEVAGADQLRLALAGG